MPTPFDTRYFAQRMIRCATVHAWQDALHYAYTAETAHGAGTTVHLAAYFAFYADTYAPAPYRTTSGAPSLRSLAEAHHVAAMVQAAWAGRASLRHHPHATALQVHQRVNAFLTPAQHFAEAVHRDEGARAGDLFCRHVCQDTAGREEAEELTVADNAVIHLGWLLCAAAALHHEHNTT